MQSRESVRAVFVGAVLLIIISVFGRSLVANGGEIDGQPSKTSDLFQTNKVWSVHLRFTHEQWAAMEPKGGTTNPFDMSNMGLGMFLVPAVMRDGDKDNSGSLSSVEFRDLGKRWFDAWDRDGDGILDSKQIRAGLMGSENVGGPTMGFSFHGGKGKRNGLSALMGVEFEQVHAELEFEGQTFKDVDVRYKGNGTFMESRSTLKRPLKIDLNRFVKGQKLAGVTTLNLHNNVSDAGMMHEALAYRLYRDAGVPAPRAAYARVFVTVPGKHERKYFGLYSLIENVDKNFVADRGLGKGGAILKPSTPDLFADLGDDWEAYVPSYDPKTDPSRAEQRRVIELCRLITHGTDEQVAARLGDFIDLGEFARFLAVSAWIGDLDSILTTGQNFYVYLDPKGSRFQFIPWDKDHTFGSFGGRDQADREQHSIREPWEGRKRFLERAFKVVAFRERYLAAMAKVAEEQARPERIEAQVKGLAAAIRPAVKEESDLKLSRFDAVVAGRPLLGSFFGLGKPTSTLLMFVKNRAASVKDQLAGKAEGHVLGKPKSGDDKKPAFRFEEAMEGVLLKGLDANKDKQLSRDEFVRGFETWFVAWDTGKAGSLGEDQIRKGLNKALPFPFFGLPKRDGEKPEDKGKPRDEKSPK